MEKDLLADAIAAADSRRRQINSREARLRQYVTEYAEAVWPELPMPVPSALDLIQMEVRADAYANAHVEGEHEANKLCSLTSARECGERAAASEFVECN